MSVGTFLSFDRTKKRKAPNNPNKHPLILTILTSTPLPPPIKILKVSLNVCWYQFTLMGGETETLWELCPLYKHNTMTPEWFEPNPSHTE